MAQHDYIIDNQTSANLRADLNNALAAIVSQNSGATAPATTYANQFWYDTANDLLKQRNESNTVWITLGTVDQTNNKFEPNQTFATQAEAQAGTNNTKAMTALRTADAIAALAGTMTLLGTLTTTSGTTQTLSSLTLTGYKYLLIKVNGVSHDNGTQRYLSLGASRITDNTALTDPLYGFVFLDLDSGATSSSVSRSSTAGANSYVMLTGYSSSSTSLVFSWSGAGNFDAGSIKVYGVK